MEIRRVLQSLISLVGQGSSPAKPVQPLQALQAGQRLEARVLAQVSARQLLLEMAGQRVVAESRLPLPPGTRVKLEVIRPGLQPRLRLLEPDRLLRPANLKVLLPRQIPLAEAMQGLANLTVNATSGRSLPPPLQEQVARLLQSLPTLKDLASADKLAEGLRQSGLFSEASLPNSHADLKQQLLQLADVIRQLRLPSREPATKAMAPESPPVPPSPEGEKPASTPLPSVMAEPDANTPAKLLRSRPNASHPPHLQDSTPQSARLNKPEGQDRIEQLFQKVSGAVARIVLDQLASLPKPETPTLTWHFELPFRQDPDVNSLRLTIQGEKAASSRDPGARPWSVDLEMDLPRLGQIHAKLIYVDGGISTYLWSDQATTRALFDRHLEQLALRFHKAGLTPKTFQVVETAINMPPANHDVPLIDERM